ncbi:MAG: folylpolyglutamate synthase/dihydrofolate synthase family protein [Nitrospirota bacterium]
MAARSHEEALRWLARCDHSVIRPGLERIERILHAWGEPQARLSAVHLAGTNGKGSTAAMTAAILRAAGRRTGLYTSPHLHALNERMRIDGRPISTARLAALADELRALLLHADGGAGERSISPDYNDPPTYFESTTAMAFAYFAQEAVDWAVIETGLGGRFDATNMVAPRLSVLTPIDYDHMNYLGDSLTAIAWEKAGILKAGVPAVIAPQPPEAEAVIEREAQRVGAPLIRCGREFFYEEEAGGRFTYRDRRRTLPHLHCPLPGRHQLMNAAAATAAALALRASGLPIADEAIAAGLASVRWEGRLEVLQERPRLLLDGAHNPAAARALAAFLADEKRRLGGRVTAVFGIMRDKAVSEVVAALRPVVDHWIATAPPAMPRALPAEEVAAAVERAGGSVTLSADPASALAVALPTLGPRDLCCVTGSFYTVACAREWFLGERASAPSRDGRVSLVPH